jgi:mannose-1-phosphate guanylyltransferase/mannose-6-phosphate isomerase
LKIIVLAGGGGTRLWPLSRQKWPKQFLSLSGGDRETSLLVDTAHRCIGQGIQPADIHIVTGAALQEPVIRQLRSAGLEAAAANVICEPARRNTAPAIALAAQQVYEQCGDRNEVLAILPADHAFEDPLSFRLQLKEAASLAAQGYIVTLGIQPDKPETGYGYIEMADPRAGASWFPVRRFVEKPDLATARRYVDSGAYLWNAGIFLVTIGTLLDSLKAYAPDIHDLLQAGAAQACERFQEMPDISIDYAVMEKARNIAVVPLRSAWSDLGSWDNVYENMKKDGAANALQAENVQMVDTAGCLIWSETDRHIATIGLEDCLIVDTPDALLITRKGQSQDVKHVTKGLESGRFPVSEAPLSRRENWGSFQQLPSTPGPEESVCRVAINPGRAVTIPSGRPVHWCVQSGNGHLMERHFTRRLSPRDSWEQPEEAFAVVAGEQGITLVSIGDIPAPEALKTDASPTVQALAGRHEAEDGVIPLFDKAYKFVRRLSQLQVF